MILKIRMQSTGNSQWTIVKRLSTVFMMTLIVFCTSACKVYRFTDAAVDPNLKSFTMAQTINIATLQNPNGASAFTEKLKDKFLRDTRLVLLRESGDLEFSATITEYSIDPVSITNTETTAQNRLNISVKIDCTNRKDATKNYSQTFRDGENYDANKQFSEVENALLNTIFDRLVQQIFNRTFGNW